MCVCVCVLQAVRLSYVHFLKTVLTRPLRERGAEGAQECVDMLEEYGLSRDDLFEVCLGSHTHINTVPGHHDCDSLFWHC